jgi:hypothetical protein
MRRKGFLISGIILIFLGVSLFVFARANEDTWIKDLRGVYVKHGVPSVTPDYVLEQQNAINCSLQLLNSFNGTLDSQCLGTCGNYAVDIVHIPRSSADNLAENQCQAYVNKSLSHFIELDKEGNVIQVV